MIHTRLRQLAWLALALACLPARAGAGSIEPQRPRQGSEITITYDPAVEGAAFVAADDVHVVIWIRYPLHGDEVWFPMTLDLDGVFRATFSIPYSAAFVETQFATPHDFDQGAAAATIVTGADGAPARGAMQRMILRGGGEAAFEEEIELYPDNWVAYTQRWRLLSFEDQQRLPGTVERDLETIRSSADADSTTRLFAEVMGALELEREDEARAALEQLVRNDPESPLVSEAFYEYWVASFKKQWSGEGPDRVAAIRRDYIRQQPDSKIARESCETLAYDETFPLDAIDDIGETWIAEQPDHPTPYLCMAEARLIREVDPEGGSEHVDVANRLTLRGHLRFYDSVAGQLVPRALSRGYLVSGRLSMLQDRPEAALAAFRAAQATALETDASLSLWEGRLWSELGDAARAEVAWREAFRTGSEEAEQKLQALYRERGGDEAGLEAWLYRKDEREAGEDLAPTFQVSDMRGEKLDLEDLRGKVVVMNFWSTGCGPCVLEMPGLNQLVEEFGDQGVVFIAPAPDSRKILKRFLKERPFLYRVVPEAETLLDAYGILGYPVHLIIDREGRIVSRMTGGSADRHEDLRPIIARSLR